MKKVCCFALSLVMLLTLVGLVPASAEEVPEITFMINESGTTADPDNPVLSAINEKLGIKLNPIQVASGDAEAKLNTMIAAKNLPDLFTVDLNDAAQFIEEGMLMPLDEFLAEYGAGINAEVGNILNKMPANQIDGNIYMIAKGSTAYTTNLAVRVDWLKNLGLEMPTDLDSLYDVLHAFTYNDPDGNGQQDTIGIVMTMAQTRQWNNIFGAFGICYDDMYLMEDGTVTTYMKAPQYLEAIKYLRKLYQAGVMDAEFATMPAMTAHERLWTGRCGVYGFESTGTTNNWYPGRYTFDVPEDPSEVFGYANIVGPDGIGGAPKQYPSLTGGWVVSSTCKNPEAVIKFLNFLYTEEGDELTYLGVEGLMYEWVDKEHGIYKRLGEFADDATQRANGGFVYWTRCIENHTEVRTMNAITQEAQAMARETAIDHPVLYSVVNASTEYGSTLSEITQEALAQLIVTTGDLEAEYQAFVERWENEGGLEFEKEATEIYQNQIRE